MTGSINLLINELINKSLKQANRKNSNKSPASTPRRTFTIPSSLLKQEFYQQEKKKKFKIFNLQVLCIPLREKTKIKLFKL